MLLMLAMRLELSEPNVRLPTVVILPVTFSVTFNGSVMSDSEGGGGGKYVMLDVRLRHVGRLLEWLCDGNKEVASALGEVAFAPARVAFTPSSKPVVFSAAGVVLVALLRRDASEDCGCGGGSRV